MKSLIFIASLFISFGVFAGDTFRITCPKNNESLPGWAILDVGSDHGSSKVETSIHGKELFIVCYDQTAGRLATYRKIIADDMRCNINENLDRLVERDKGPIPCFDYDSCAVVCKTQTNP